MIMQKKKKRYIKKSYYGLTRYIKKNTILEDSKKLYSVLIDENFKLKKLR